MFDLDISAPQIRVPESFNDDNSVIVVFDLGHLRWQNKHTEPETRGSAIGREGLQESSDNQLDDDGKYR